MSHPITKTPKGPIFNFGYRLIVPLCVAHDGKVYLSFFENPEWPVPYVDPNTLTSDQFLGALNVTTVESCNILLKELCVVRNRLNRLCYKCGDFLQYTGHICSRCELITSERCKEESCP